MSSPYNCSYKCSNPLPPVLRKFRTGTYLIYDDNPDDDPSCPTNLRTIFDVFVLDRSQHADPDILEAAGSQCLLLTGFFHDQLKQRHNVKWYASMGADFFDQAAHQGTDRARSHMMANATSGGRRREGCALG